MTTEKITGKTIIGTISLNPFSPPTPVWINSDGIVVFRGENGLCSPVKSDTPITPNPVIAAAPDLLEALEELVELEVCRNMHKASTAIAKATGQTK